MVMQGDLCKHLLQNSQADDQLILSLTLRVVFNLFNSIKNYLKVQLEVFLTSVGQEEPRLKRSPHVCCILVFLTSGL